MIYRTCSDEGDCDRWQCDSCGWWVWSRGADDTAFIPLADCRPDEWAERSRR